MYLDLHTCIYTCMHIHMCTSTHTHTHTHAHTHAHRYTYNICHLPSAIMSIVWTYTWTQQGEGLSRLKWTFKTPASSLIMRCVVKVTLMATNQETHKPHINTQYHYNKSYMWLDCRKPIQITHYKY